MLKPYLIIVTGQPGAGKTTFSKAFSKEAFLPVISRDEIKEGYILMTKNTMICRQGIEPQFSSYDEPRLNVPTYYIDTAEGYSPSIAWLLQDLFGR